MKKEICFRCKKDCSDEDDRSSVYATVVKGVVTDFVVAHTLCVPYFHGPSRKFSAQGIAELNQDYEVPPDSPLHQPKVKALPTPDSVPAITVPKRNPWELLDSEIKSKNQHKKGPQKPKGPGRPRTIRVKKPPKEFIKQGRPLTTPNDPLDYQVLFNVGEKLNKRLRLAVKREGISLSLFMRQILESVLK